MRRIRWPFWILLVSSVISVAAARWTSAALTPHPPPAPQPVAHAQRPCGLVAASEADWLPNNSQVVGVVHDGHARAYLLAGFQRRDDHVLNDLVGDAPISVAHCPMRRSTQVFTSGEYGKRLEIAVGGLRDFRMYVESAGRRYWQDTGLPVDPGDGMNGLPTADFVVTTWQEWRQAHGDTDIYLGNRP